MASIFGIRLIIFVFGDFYVFKEIFCGNASHLVVAFVSVVAFCGLLWSFVTSVHTAVFCGICDNYGIYGGTVGLQCISNLFLVIFTPFRGFSAKFGCFGRNMIFWFGAKRIHGCFDDFSLDLNFGLIIFVFRCIRQPWKAPCQICRGKKKLQVRRCRAKSAEKKIQGEKMPSQLCQ